MSIFDIPTTSDAEIMADIKKRMANSQTVTDDDLHRITGSTEPQVIMPMKLLAKLLEQSVALKEENDLLKTRVAELEGLVRDIKQADIDETAKRILDSGRKFNYSLPLKIRERIAAALKEPANEG